MFAPRLITPPASEPVTLAEAKAHLRVDCADEDLLISSLISAARTRAEEYAGVAMLTQTWELWLGELEGAVYLPRHPATAVTEVAYTTEAGEQAMPAALYTALPKLGMVNFRSPPPALAYRIRFTAGWASRAEVPQTLKNAVLRTVANLYEFREDQTSGVNHNPVPLDAQALLNPYRRWML